MIVDNINDEVEDMYKSEPDRLYVVGVTGTIAWKSGLGPFYFDVEGWYQALKRQL